MSFLKQIDDDIKNAMKSKDSFTLGVLRLIKTELKNKEIELIRAVNETEFLALITKMVKQRKDSAEQYQNGGRQDLADQELQESTVLSRYLPTPLTDEEVQALITNAIAKTGATSGKDMGLVIKELKEATAGRVDGKLLADKVKQSLGA